MLINKIRRNGLRSGIDWMREKFGEEKYKGHLGIYGNAIIASSAYSNCLEFVLEPEIRLQIEDFAKVINADLAVKCSKYLLILEVKAHHKGDITFDSQLDGIAFDKGPFLKRRGVRVETLHLVFHDAKPADNIPKWNRMFRTPFHEINNYWNEVGCL